MTIVIASLFLGALAVAKLPVLVIGKSLVAEIPYPRFFSIFWKFYLSPSESILKVASTAAIAYQWRHSLLSLCPVFQ